MYFLGVYKNAISKGGYMTIWTVNMSTDYSLKYMYF